MQNDYLVKENDTIKFALSKTNETFFGKIICVVDNKGRLLGGVTAGDLRRAILSGHGINEKIKKIYNKKISFIYENELKQRKFKFSNFNNKEIIESIFYIPIVDKNKKVKNILSAERIIEIIENKNLKKSTTHKNPTVLIIGGAGYIGSVLCKKLLKQNYPIKVVDKLLYDQSVIKILSKNRNFKFIKADICDLNTQINAIKDVDAVVFLAEIVGDPACNARPEDALKTNFLSISSMAQLCSHLGISKFIYTSSCSVYGLDKKNRLLTEKSNLNPISHYARMKIMSEKALLAIKNEIFKPTIFRLGTVFGPSIRNRFDLVVNTMAKNAYYKKKIILYGGEQWRPNIHVEDVADGIICALKTNSKIIGNKIFNLSSDKSNFKIKELAFSAKKEFKNSEVKVIKNMIDLRNYRVSSQEFYKKTGFRAKKTVSQAYKSFNNFFKKNIKFNPEKKLFSNIKILNEN